ncbi:MAG: glycosyltransferase family 2 protein [Rickettsiales bacterium]|nr:glycosyltransferase family 2 protein [Rickettsiales bacterium]
MLTKAINNHFEAQLASVCIAATALILGGLFYSLAQMAYTAYQLGNMRYVWETALFMTGMVFVAYGNFLYQICLRGHYKRREQHKPVDASELYKMYQGTAPALSILIPSYKEERTVNWQTMMSAALAEYPSKHVVLLIDDPYPAKSLPDMVKLEDTRKIPVEMQALFDAQAAHYRAEQDAFRVRGSVNYQCRKEEMLRLAANYAQAANWFHDVATDFMGGKTLDEMNHADRFFVEAILYAPAAEHEAFSQHLRDMAKEGNVPMKDFFACHYARLAGLFTVHFSSFERKKYANLSHEANKAMNLNSYMALVGKSWKEVPHGSALHLIETTPEEADFTIADADYLNTIDSDSLMLSEYALRLIHIMEQPGNKKLAVIQSPCSSFPGCPKGLERTAGASIDVQFLTHQGYTHWDATFWVGANAMLRRTALEEIKEVHMKDGHPISIYIQDRTVIEDTESTIDLVHKGWKLYNYPERMTFSATPPDFGSLLIQRRRWSNGGLLILPKLFNYVFRAKKEARLFKELFMRFHYLASTTTGCVVALLFCFYPFADIFSSPLLILSIVPFFVLYTRDLKYAGYQYSDAWRICALNLMLFPIVMGGVLKSFEQIATGKKIPFSRTPKIPGRTAAPALYSMIAVAMPLAFAYCALNQYLLGHGSKAAFALINMALATYALVVFVGVRAAFEDMLAGVRSRLRDAYQNAEIIPMPSYPAVSNQASNTAAL